MNTELENRIAKLETTMASLGYSNQIPVNVQKAFEARLGGIRLADSSHSGETVSVNESGSSSYLVAGPMNGFVETTINGVTIYIPYYT